MFRDAVRLGFISDCHPLDEVDFEPFLDLELADIRRRIGLEADLILAYYAIEKRRFPESLESQRLLSD